eukprot:1878528-Pyramimonas_sp.AAC.1
MSSMPGKSLMSAFSCDIAGDIFAASIMCFRSSLDTLSHRNPAIGISSSSVNLARFASHTWSPAALAASMRTYGTNGVRLLISAST